MILDSRPPSASRHLFRRDSEDPSATTHPLWPRHHRRRPLDAALAPEAAALSAAETTEQVALVAADELKAAALGAEKPLELQGLECLCVQVEDQVQRLLSDHLY